MQKNEKKVVSWLEQVVCMHNKQRVQRAENKKRIEKPLAHFFLVFCFLVGSAFSRKLCAHHQRMWSFFYSFAINDENRPALFLDFAWFVEYED